MAGMNNCRSGNESVGKRRCIRFVMNKDVQVKADFALALSLQERFENEAEVVALTKETSASAISSQRSIVDASWELVDPVPNIHQLFLDYDAMFFKSVLVNSGVEVKWSHRMTLCAGVCSYEGRGGLCSVRLSSPLLKLRPRRDLVQTLLHEMIHAYLFVTANNKDHDAHGPNFLEHMHRINHLTGAKITVYHSFHNEVNEYRQHWWRCTGPCRNRPPFYGFVKRAMNRPPSSQDYWWAKHEATCGGKYIKVREPEGYKKKVSGASGGSGPSGSSGASGGSDDQMVADGKIKVRGKKDGNIKDLFNGSSKRGSADTCKRLDHPKDVLPSRESSSSQGHVLGSSADAGITPPLSPNSLRNKLAAAAEKRLKESTVKGKGKGHRSGSSVTRSVDSKKQLHQGTTVDDCIVIEADDPAATTNTPYSNSHKTMIEMEGSPSSSKQVALATNSDIAPISCDATKHSCDIIDLDDFPSTSVHSSSTEWEPTGLKTCPVCGRNDIPPAIINTHIALCLEEESFDSFFED